MSSCCHGIVMCVQKKGKKLPKNKNYQYFFSSLGNICMFWAMSCCCHGDGWVCVRTRREELFLILPSRLFLSRPRLLLHGGGCPATYRLAQIFTLQYVYIRLYVCFYAPQLYLALTRESLYNWARDGHHLVGRLGAFHRAVQGLVLGTLELLSCTRSAD